MWFYKDSQFTSDDIKDYIGFVYLITNNLTDKKYVGKKKFITNRRKIVKGKRKRIKAESDWQEYYGSSTALQEDVEKLGAEKFNRTILHLCKSKGLMNYMELKEQIDREVLLREDYYNSYVGARIHRSHLQKST